MSEEAAYIVVYAEPDDEGRLWRDFEIDSIVFSQESGVYNYDIATVCRPGKAIVLARFSIIHGLMLQATNVPGCASALCFAISDRTPLRDFYEALWMAGLAFAVEELIPDYASIYTICPLKESN